MSRTKNKYLIFTAIILLGLVLTLIGLIEFNQTHTGIQELEPDFEVDPIRLYSAFEGNELKANRLYLGKIIELEGEILNIEIPSAGTANIVIKALEDSFGGINCSFISVDIPLFKTLKKGDQVKIRGECAGFLMDVNLSRCVLISS